MGRRDLGPDVFRIDLAAPELAQDLRPGQFIQVKIAAPGHDPLLRRPFGYLTRYPAAGQISLVVRAVGRGTAALRSLRPGDELMALGPLGKGFTLDPPGPVLLIAGGIGMVPLYNLAETLAPRVPVTFVYGARTGRELYFLPQMRELPMEVLPATEDGSAGTRGTVVAAISALDPRGFARYYSCGPRPMLAAVQSVLGSAGLPGEISLEERMACGFGACLGCAVPVRGRGNEIGFKRVCADGPVFTAGEVVFDELSGS